MLAPLHVTPVPGRCSTCKYGCGCPLDGPGCEHYGCYGRWPSRSCPGVSAEEEVYEEACHARRREDARRLRARATLTASLRAVGIVTP